MTPPFPYPIGYIALYKYYPLGYNVTKRRYYTMGLTDKIDYFLIDNSMNKAELARESGIPYTTIDGFYKKGTDNVKLSTLKRLSAYMNCTIDFLVNDDSISNQNEDIFTEKNFEDKSKELHHMVLTEGMIENDDTNYTESLFDTICHVNEYGQEFWYARELQVALEYKRWDKFNNVIEKAKTACECSKNKVSEHFSHVGKTSTMPNGGTKEIGDIQLSRYACYLIVQNGDPRKKVIALGQSYFAIKTRQQELIENYNSLDEDQKRLAIRREMIKHNKLLVAAAKDAGVETSLDYAIFQNYGYMGLYGGMKAQDIKQHKGLKKNDDILDHMGYEELAANLFRATQTEAKLKRENIQGKENANQTHYDVGKKVRQTIVDLGGTLPENLPTPEKSIKQIEREQKQLNLK